MTAEKLIQRLDRLASCGKYDDAAIFFGYSGSLIFSWQEDKLQGVQSWLKRDILPVAFIAFTRHEPIIEIRIWQREWDVTGETPGYYQNLLLGVDEVLRCGRQ
jgi:hypothetical protein